MERIAYLTGMVLVGTFGLHAQTLGPVQFHGFGTQSVLYSSHGNYLTPSSSEGDPGWTELAVSATYVPKPKLRLGVQGHYFKLSDLGGNGLSIDWALADYKVNRLFGIRAGKVKTPLGLFNDSQDIDAVHLWSLLPQSTYQIDNRSFFLAHWGGEVYGSVRLGEKVGKLAYRSYGGHSTAAPEGGIVEEISTATGLKFASGPSGEGVGGDLRWQTGWKPLMLGSSVVHQNLFGTAPGGSADVHALVDAFYAQYEGPRFYAAGEYRRQIAHVVNVVGPYTIPNNDDQRQWFAMASYRPAKKLQVGTYYSHMVDESVPRSQQASNSKDFVQSVRFDISSNFYAKAENHFLHGTALGFYADDNRQGLTSRTELVVGKLGFYF